MNHPIHFVSLGPGDPELITLKGLKTLQKADIIYCPATQGKHGIISRATDILKAIEVDESLIHPFILPMSKERADALNAYNELFLDAQAERETNRDRRRGRRWFLFIYTICIR